MELTLEDHALAQGGHHALEDHRSLEDHHALEDHRQEGHSFLEGLH